MSTRTRGPLFIAFALMLACGSSPSPSTSAVALGPIGAVSDPVPAGRWMHDDLEHSGCIDCATPRFAVIRAAAGRAPSSAELLAPPVCYPLLMLPHELGLPSTADELSQAVLVHGMFEDRASAEAWWQQHERAGEVVAIDLARARKTPVVVRVRREATGYDEASLGAEGLTAISSDGTPEGPTCTLPEGHIALVDVDDHPSGDVMRVPDAHPWIRLTCDGHATLFRVADTDFGLIVRSDVREVIETQWDGGVCGVLHYRQRVFDRDPRMLREQELETARCFDQPAVDSWGVCPDGALSACVDRARALLQEGEDLRRAARIAIYACEWGAESSCILRWRIDLARGVAASEVLGSAVGHCDMDDPDKQPTGEMCIAVDELFRSIDPTALQHETDSVRGSIARQGCLRQIPGWCELLESSDLCDLDGCG